MHLLGERDRQSLVEPGEGQRAVVLPVDSVGDDDRPVGGAVEELLERFLNGLARTADAIAAERDVVGGQVAQVAEAFVEPRHELDRLRLTLELEQRKRGESSLRTMGRRAPRAVGVLLTDPRLVLPVLARLVHGRVARAAR